MSIGTIRNLGFLDEGTKVPSPLIPAMTSNTTPSGYVASASQEYSSAWSAWRAFDSSNSSHWVTSNTQSGWVQIQFPTAVKAKGAMCHPYYEQENQLKAKDCTVLGSNDENTWFQLGFVAFPNKNVGNVYFALNNDTAYRYYRFVNSGSYVSAGYSGYTECQLYNANPEDAFYNYIYKDGKQSVAWDNSGTYISESGYYSAGGATLNDGNMSFSTPSTSMYNRAIITDSVIDVSQYSTLKVACVYNNAEHVLSVDISSIVSSGYIALSQSNYSGQRFFTIVVATQKNNFSVNHLAQLVTNTNANSVVVSRVWLEK